MIRSYDPNDTDDVKQAERYGAQPWMLAAMKVNPSYVFWGPGEDSMRSVEENGGWSSGCEFATWAESAFRGLDQLNLVVHYYFFVDRDQEKCRACDGGGYAPFARQLNDTFYEGWGKSLNIDDVRALVAAGRCRVRNAENTEGVSPVVDEILVLRVNLANLLGGIGSDFYHDVINRHVLVAHRCDVAGADRTCRECDGSGYVFTADHARLGLVRWVLHPRKGASRGVVVKSIARAELPEVYAHLREAAAFNARMFDGVHAVAP